MNLIVNMWYCCRIGISKGLKHFKPRPQNRILVPLRGSFQSLRGTPPPFYIGVSLGADQYCSNLTTMASSLQVYFIIIYFSCFIFRLQRLTKALLKKHIQYVTLKTTYCVEIF